MSETYDVLPAEEFKHYWFDRLPRAMQRPIEQLPGSTAFEGYRFGADEKNWQHIRTTHVLTDRVR